MNLKSIRSDEDAVGHLDKDQRCLRAFAVSGILTYGQRSTI